MRLLLIVLAIALFPTAALAAADCNKMGGTSQIEKRLQCLQTRNEELEKALSKLKKELEDLQRVQKAKH